MFTPKPIVRQRRGILGQLFQPKTKMVAIAAPDPPIGQQVHAIPDFGVALTLYKPPVRRV